MKKMIITVDTEGDNLWNVRMTPGGFSQITTKHAGKLDRFQILCEKYNYIPTYLTNYEMSQAKPFVVMAKSAMKSGKAEIGMHMHAWNSPPIYNLRYTGKSKPYLGDYARNIQAEKMKYLTKTLEDVFQTDITSFRNGRWYIDEYTVFCLKKLGFLVDCTITPSVSWREQKGNHIYGTDNSKCQLRGAYMMSGKNIHKKGHSGIYEVPPTILRKTSLSQSGIRTSSIWLRPNRDNLSDMLWIVNKIKKHPFIDYVEFMIHSSELVEGENPTFRSSREIEKLYSDLDVLFSEISRDFKGIGLTNYVKEKYKK